MSENKFYDYATGKEVKNNPEEVYRQLFEHILIEDLGYPKTHICCHYFYSKIKTGKGKRNSR